MRYYQEEAIQAICEFQKSDLKIARIYMATSTGKTLVIVSAIERLLKEKMISKVLILSRRRIQCEQQSTLLKKRNNHFEIAMSIQTYCDQNILLTTIQDVQARKDKFDCEIFDLILLDEAEFYSERKGDLFLGIGHAKLLGFISGPENGYNLFSSADEIYRYTIKDAISDGYLEDVTNTHLFVENLLVNLLRQNNYENVLVESVCAVIGGHRYIPDIIAEKNQKKYIFEVKSFRSREVSYGQLEQAIAQVNRLREKLLETQGEMICVVVMPCEITQDILEDIFNRNNVIVWDISNLIYLCGENLELRELLNCAIPYPIGDLEGHKPVNDILQSEQNVSEIQNSEISYTEKFMKELEACEAGKEDKSDKKFEELCTEIIRYLFGTEFLKMSEQHKTEDEMFRMDLLCSLKGTTEFWKFLIQFYNTKFVVFEYKNYSDYVSQNVIYVTEKYLFSAVLRKVAIIISRQGFDPNAQKAAMGCLKEHGKLIISITDKDLLKMVAKKEGGEEPSDYLLERVEDLLMSVSK